MLSTAPKPTFTSSSLKCTENVSGECQGQSSWIVSLPAPLMEYSSELEALMNKVFKNCPKTGQNIELAKQLAINWCNSKCKELDIPSDSLINQIVL